MLATQGWITPPQLVAGNLLCGASWDAHAVTIHNLRAFKTALRDGIRKVRSAYETDLEAAIDKAFTKLRARMDTFARATPDPAFVAGR